MPITFWRRRCWCRILLWSKRKPSGGAVATAGCTGPAAGAALRAATSFLGGTAWASRSSLRSSPRRSQGYTPVAQAQPVYGQTAPGYQPVTQPGYAPVSQPQYMPAGQPQFVPVGGGQPSFMRGAMQTAAGVAAGALAFEGVEAVLHGIGGMGHPGYGWGGMGGGGFGRWRHDGRGLRAAR